MPAIKYDNSKYTEINESIIKENESLQQAANMASSVSLPNDSFGWSNVVAELKSCCDDLKKYNKWINEINSSYINCLIKGNEQVKKLTVETVSKTKLM